MPPEDTKPSVNQEQVHDLLFNREIGWQEIIYDLINTEQLDPWDINISTLTDKYMEKIQELEGDFFISSKVLLAAALLLRIKSEILLNKYIKSIDEILFGSKEVIKKPLERMELDDQIPELIPRSPIPRYKKVTLQELMESLGKAITTENRRIKREIVKSNALREVGISLPKRTISIKDKIKELYQRVQGHLKNEKQRVSFSDLVGTTKEEKLVCFSPLLHLENQNKLWLDQNAHFEEIYVWMKNIYFKNNPDPFESLKDEIASEIDNLDDESKSRIEEINSDFENPLGDMLEKEE